MRYHSQETIDRVIRLNAQGVSKRQISASLNIPRQTVQTILRRAAEAGGEVKARACPVRDTAAQPRSLPDIPEPLTPAERRDADFYRRQLAEVRRDLDETRHALREMAGLSSAPLIQPAWSLPSGGGQRNRAVGLLHISDTHVGEVVAPGEINGINAYDVDTFRRRIRRLISASIEILPRWAADCELKGIVVAFNGDLVSGDIHDELRRTNALSANAQVIVCCEEFAAAIRHLAEAFGKVWAIFTPGNHGRSTEKTHAKRTAELSYDTMIGRMLAREFAADRRVEFYAPGSRDAIYPILGHPCLQSHGDALGTGGGQGFAGPGLPIIRGAKKVEYSAMLIDQRYSIILTAHYHTSMNIGRVFANGSVIGFNEFAHKIRATPEPPMQWLMLVHERWGVRERAEIKLEAPPKAEAPKIRIEAGR